MEMINDDVIQMYPSVIRSQLRELRRDGKAGISTRGVRIELDQRNIHNNESRPTSFLLEIPFAGRFLKWEVIFTDDDLTFAPDVYFPPKDEFLTDPDINVIATEVPSLCNWDVKKPSSLMSVIREFLALYKKHQIEKLEIFYQHEYTEYSLLISDVTITKDDVEVMIDQNENVNFLIAIKTNLDNLPPFVQNDYFKDNKVRNSGEDVAFLKVIFGGPRVLTYLQLSPGLESAIGLVNQMHIPSYNKDSGLITYVPEIKELLQRRIDEVIENHNKCHDYINAVLSYHGNGIVDYDRESFSSISFLAEQANFLTLVTIKLSKKFPKEAPEVTLYSVYYEENGKPVQDTIAKYNYQPNAEPEQMVHALLLFLRTRLPKFRALSYSKRS